MKHLKECSYCKRMVFKLACRNPQDLCAACYYRNKKNGTLEYVKVRKLCSIDGCDGLAVGNGYCDKHYRRFKRHGTPTPGKAENWGHSHSHPLYDRWRWVRHRRPAIGLDPLWEDFWQFVRDVGEPPSSRHTLQRIDESKPYGPRNFIWREPKTDVLLVDKKSHAEYMRVYRIKEPERFWRIDLKKNYGVTIEQYEAMLAAQNGVCAICGNTERSRSPAKDGRVRHLAVDHCHNGKHVRGLLCSPCNTMIGLANDDIERLRSAIAYLEKHAAKKDA